MVCNLHFPTGDYLFQNFLEFGIEGEKGEKTLPVSWLYEKLSLLLPRPGREPTTSRTPRLHNKQEVPHPTRSAIGRRLAIVIHAVHLRLLILLTTNQQIIYSWMSPVPPGSATCTPYYVAGYATP